MNKQPLIVISLEGFATSSLGCYGSSWNQTPAIDRLANSGCVWDRFLANSDQPTDVFSDWISPKAFWASQLAGSIELITDRSASDIGDSCFDTVLCLPCDSPEAEASPCDDIAETRFGRLVAAAIERDREDAPWGVLWIHSRFLTQCWDAPRELMLAEEEPTSDFSDGHFDESKSQFDPRPSTQNTRPPRIELSESSDPDTATDWMNAYGCQIRLVDLLLDILLESIQVEDPSIVLLGTSGFRLGQGKMIGHREGPLRSPDIRLPLIINRDGPLHAPQLTLSDQLGKILENLADASAAVCAPESWSASLKQEESFIIRSDRATTAITNANWFYVKDADQSEHLFLKPDDVEDFNDVGRLRSDVIETLESEHPTETKNDRVG